MIAFKLFGTDIRLDFSFFAVLALFFFFDSGMGICAFVSCIFHELGHLIVMRICDIPIERLLFYGGGIRLSADIERSSFPVRLAVLFAGCAFNLLLAGVLLCAGAHTAAAVNVFICLLNLLPISYLDGAQLARAVIFRFCEPRRAERTLRIFQLLILTAVSALAVFAGVLPDITLLVFAVYCLIAGRFCRG